MANFLPLLSLLLPVALFHQSLASEVPNPNPKPPSAAHSQLTNYGFPIGLLPSSVRGYTLNQTSGEFSVDLGIVCRITLPPDNYLATYSKSVTGKIVQGRIAELDGIRVRAFFKWWSITGLGLTERIWRSKSGWLPQNIRPRISMRVPIVRASARIREKVSFYAFATLS